MGSTATITRNSPRRHRDNSTAGLRVRASREDSVTSRLSFVNRTVTPKGGQWTWNLGWVATRLQVSPLHPGSPAAVSSRS